MSSSRLSKMGWTMAILFCASGCKDKAADEQPASGKASDGEQRLDDGKEPGQATGDGPFAAWDMAARRAAFEGAHLTPGSSLGTWEAWEVKGDKVTVYDGNEDKTYDFAVTTPCTATISETSGGGTSTTTFHYTLRNGEVLKGLGGAGSHRGDQAVACISNVIVTLDEDGSCLEWSQSMFDKSKFESKPGQCGWKGEGDARQFVTSIGGREVALLVDGDALLSEQLQGTHSETVADFAAAKAARDAKQ